MNPGSLSERVSLKYVSSSSLDRFGQTMVTYASSSIWAYVKRLSGGENAGNGVVSNYATYAFTVRKRSEILDSSELVYEGNTYNIVFIDEPFSGYYKLTAERRN